MFLDKTVPGGLIWGKIQGIILIKHRFDSEKRNRNEIIISWADSKQKLSESDGCKTIKETQNKANHHRTASNSMLIDALSFVDNRSSETHGCQRYALKHI